MKEDLKKHNIFLIRTLVFTSVAKKTYKIQSKNIIMCYEFDAEMHLDAQNIKQFCYRSSALEFLQIAHTHLNTHGHTNSSTHIILSVDALAHAHTQHSSHAQTSLICIFLCF